MKNLSFFFKASVFVLCFGSFVCSAESNFNSIFAPVTYDAIYSDCSKPGNSCRGYKNIDIKRYDLKLFGQTLTAGAQTFIYTKVDDKGNDVYCFSNLLSHKDDRKEFDYIRFGRYVVSKEKALENNDGMLCPWASVVIKSSRYGSIDSAEQINLISKRSSDLEYRSKELELAYKP